MQASKRGHALWAGTTKATSTTSSLTGKACRWPHASWAPTATTAHSCARLRCRCHRCAAGAVAHATAIKRYCATTPTAASLAGAGCTSHGLAVANQRWVVNRTILRPRQMRTRLERRADNDETIVTLGSVLLCWKQLPSSSGKKLNFQLYTLGATARIGGTDVCH